VIEQVKAVLPSMELDMFEPVTATGSRVTRTPDDDVFTVPDDISELLATVDAEI
jgi:hypothetical protein